ncbi:hypothetical protein WJX73_001139 [Symbiochloris irregularis]|uniref:RNA exonuclease 4 n=1 Tax=Symbiochloris irregularis TaxID=706552 RepID=A0AAW1PB22_9CHLO
MRETPANLREKVHAGPLWPDKPSGFLLPDRWELFDSEASGLAGIAFQKYVPPISPLVPLPTSKQTFSPGLGSTQGPADQAAGVAEYLPSRYETTGEAMMTTKADNARKAPATDTIDAVFDLYRHKLAAMAAARTPGPSRRLARREAGAQKGLLRSLGGSAQPGGNRITSVRVLFFDCEFGGPRKLAQVAVVAESGEVLLDKQRMRCLWQQGLDDSPGDGFDHWAEVEKDLIRLFKDPDVVVGGHQLHNDLAAFNLLDLVPVSKRRDSAFHPPLQRRAADGVSLEAESLQLLAAREVGLQIQDGPHAALEDANASRKIYAKRGQAWEAYLRRTKVSFVNIRIAKKGKGRGRRA